MIMSMSFGYIGIFKVLGSSLIEYSDQGFLGCGENFSAKNIKMIE